MTHPIIYSLLKFMCLFYKNVTYNFVFESPWRMKIKLQYFQHQNLPELMVKT